MESTSKVLRKDSALNSLRELTNLKKNNEQINDAYFNQTVITYYNKRNYRVSSVDFSKNPLSYFTLTDGQTITYLDYYQKRYNLPIKDINQPLFLHKDKKDENKLIYLVPELCYMTGLTDKQRGDFRLMKEIATITKLNA